MTSSLGFPLNPTINDQYTIGTRTFVWDGTVWNAVSSGGGTPLSQEEVQDYIAPLFNHSSHSNLTAVYDDDNNKILLNAQGGSGGATDIGLIIGLS